MGAVQAPHVPILAARHLALQVGAHHPAAHVNVGHAVAHGNASHPLAHINGHHPAIRLRPHALIAHGKHAPTTSSSSSASSDASANLAATAAPAPTPTPAPAPTATPTPTPTSTTPGPATTDPTLLTLDLKPLDINLLGLEVQTSEIMVTISAQPGSGALLGNLLTDVSGLLNLQGVNTALNNVLGSVVTLVNSASLSVGGVSTSGPLVPTQGQPATTPVLEPARRPGQPEPAGGGRPDEPDRRVDHGPLGAAAWCSATSSPTWRTCSTRRPRTARWTSTTSRPSCQTLLSELPAADPGPPRASSATTTTTTGTDQVLSLTVPPIDLNLLGLILKTGQIQVNVDAQSGNGDLLGNLLTGLLNTLGATPQNLGTLNTS